MVNIALNLIVLRSRDLDSAARFYGALGIAFTREKHDTGPEHLASDFGPVVLEIYPLTNAANTASVRVGFCVPSVDTAVAAVQALGAPVLTPPQKSPWGRRAVVADPDGHRVELSEGQSRNPGEILAKIAALPMEPGGREFTGRDHDKVLYGDRGTP